MIKFFRKIRYNLMEQNKTGKYFKYAIGEIVLVVIGILLALQINNWNESKKIAVYEGKILYEIYRSLQADSSRIESWIKPRFERSLRGAENLIEFIHLKTYPNDSILDENLWMLNANPQLTVNFGPFEALKSSGLDKIKNDELRFWLIDAFESVFPRQLNFIKISESDYKDFRENTEIKFFKPTTYQDGDGKIKITYNISKGVFMDERLLRYINNKYNISATKKYRSGIIQETISATLQKMRTYFETNNIDYFKFSQDNLVSVSSQLSDSTTVKHETNK